MPRTFAALTPASRNNFQIKRVHIGRPSGTLSASRVPPPMEKTRKEAFVLLTAMQGGFARAPVHESMAGISAVN
jgi:hypothetical protein